MPAGHSSESLDLPRASEAFPLRSEHSGTAAPRCGRGREEGRGGEALGVPGTGRGAAAQRGGGGGLGTGGLLLPSCELLHSLPDGGGSGLRGRGLGCGFRCSQTGPLNGFYSRIRAPAGGRAPPVTSELVVNCGSRQRWLQGVAGSIAEPSLAGRSSWAGRRTRGLVGGPGSWVRAQPSSGPRAWAGRAEPGHRDGALPQEAGDPHPRSPGAGGMHRGGVGRPGVGAEERREPRWEAALVNPFVPGVPVGGCHSKRVMVSSAPNPTSSGV